MKVSEEQRQRAIYLTQASVVLLGPSGRCIEGRGLMLYRLTVERHGIEAVQVWKQTPQRGPFPGHCVLCVTDCGEVELYAPEPEWEETLLAWSAEVAHADCTAASRAETPTPSLQLAVQVHSALLEQAREAEQQAQRSERVLNALEEAGAAMVRSYERWLMRNLQPPARPLPRASRSVAWTGNPEQPGQVVTWGVPTQTKEDVVRESTALFLRGFGYGEYY
jgi:hypothetical protein